MAETFANINMQDKDITNARFIDATGSSFVAITASSSINTPTITSSSFSLNIRNDINMTGNDITGISYLSASSAAIPSLSTSTFESGFSVDGTINMQDNTITNLSEPGSPTDAATKQYVDNKIVNNFTVYNAVAEYTNLPTAYIDLLYIPVTVTNAFTKVIIMFSGNASMDGSSEDVYIKLTKDSTELPYSSFKIASWDVGCELPFSRQYIDVPGEGTFYYGVQAKSDEGRGDITQGLLSLTLI